MPRIDDEYDSMMNMMPTESSSESNLRANAAAKGSALAKESYSEQRLRKNAKPMVKAKAKAKPVVGRAGAQTPGQRAKLAPAKSADAARAGAMSKPKASSTGGYPRPTAKTTSTGARSSVKRPAVMSNAGKAGSVRGASSPAKKTATKPATNSRFASVAATNAKRMGISVAEYNKRANAKRGK